MISQTAIHMKLTSEKSFNEKKSELLYEKKKHKKSSVINFLIFPPIHSKLKLHLFKNWNTTYVRI